MPLVAPAGFLTLFLMFRLPPSSTLFPYTTLFRSLGVVTSRSANVNIIVDTVPPSALTAIAPAGNGTQFDVLFSEDRKSTRLNSSHRCISYAVFCLKKKNKHLRNSNKKKSLE